MKRSEANRTRNVRVQPSHPSFRGWRLTRATISFRRGCTRRNEMSRAQALRGLHALYSLRFSSTFSPRFPGRMNNKGDGNAGTRHPRIRLLTESACPATAALIEIIGLSPPFNNSCAVCRVNLSFQSYTKFHEYYPWEKLHRSLV